MRRKSQRSKPKAQQNNLNNPEKEKRLQIWKIIIPAIATILAGIIPIIWNWDSIFKNTTRPQFAIEEPFLTVKDSSIVLVAINNEAKKNNPIHIEFDGFLLVNAGNFISNSDSFKWRFDIPKKLPESLLDKENHKIRAGFVDKFSDTLRFSWNSILIDMQTKKPRGKPNARIISGKVTRKHQALNENLSVGIFYEQDGKTVQLNLKVNNIKDKSTNFTYSEFEGILENVPENLQDFTSQVTIKVSDASGKSYYNFERFKDFVTPGSRSLGLKKPESIPENILPKEKIAELAKFSIESKPLVKETSSPIENKPKPTPVSSSSFSSNEPRYNILLSEETVINLIEQKGYFNSRWNRSGRGIEHTYETLKMGSTEIVVDKITGLIWQKSGSDKKLTYQEALQYIAKLNQEKYGQHNNWRLPTIEEAIALTEYQRNKYQLYINPIFDQEQKWIWSADKYDINQAWAVDYKQGNCSYYDTINFSLYVRAVYRKN